MLMIKLNTKENLTKVGTYNICVMYCVCERNARRDVIREAYVVQCT